MHIYSYICVSGQDINLSIRGLTSLDKFINLAASARLEQDILDALTFKFHHHTRVCSDYVKHGIEDTMFTWYFSEFVVLH